MNIQKLNYIKDRIKPITKMCPKCFGYGYVEQGYCFFCCGTGEIETIAECTKDELIMFLQELIQYVEQHIEEK